MDRTLSFSSSFRKSSNNNFRESLAQIAAVSVKNLILVGFGMTLGFPTILIAGLHKESKIEKLNADQLSWLGSINLIFVPIGCLLSGWFSQTLGRKRTIHLATLPLTLSWLILRFSKELWHIYAGLGLSGLLLGCIEAPVINFVAEISTPKMRGVLSSTSTMSTILGVLLVFTLGAFFNWRNVALFSTTIPIAAFNLLIVIPETPYWLISKKYFGEARISLAWFRGWVSTPAIEREYRQIYQSIHPVLDQPQKLRGRKAYFTPTFLNPFILIAFLFFLRHFTGMTNIQTYSVEIFEEINVPFNKFYVTVILGMAELLGCITCVALVRLTGRRKLTFITLLGSAASLLSVALITYLSVLKNYDLNFKFNWIACGFIITFAHLSHTSLRTLPWVLAGEVFNYETRALGTGISAGVGYGFGFLANKLFFDFVNQVTISGMFLFYGVLSIFGLVVLYFVLPETEGKTFEEIEECFVPKKVNNGESLFLSIKNDFVDGSNTYMKFMELDTPI